MDLDVQPWYIRVVVKDKVFQLALPEEVSPDKAVAERSKITGHLVVTMPKEGQEVKFPVNPIGRKAEEAAAKAGGGDGAATKGSSERELLEVPDKPTSGINIGSIVTDAAEAAKLLGKGRRERVAPRDNDEDFVDDDDVPPLE